MPHGTPITINTQHIYNTKSGDEYHIIKEIEPRVYPDGRHVRMVRIRFDKTGYENDVTLQCAITGHVLDLTAFNAIFGKEYMKLRDTLSPLDRRILKLLYRMINRCHNPNFADYPRYGAKGVRVCDEWRFNPLQFIADFKTLPGYDDWLAAPDDQKYNYHIDKDLLQQDIPIGQRVYSKQTCSIIHNQYNGRLARLEKGSSRFIGVVKNELSGTWVASIVSNNIKYYLGTYSSEIAAASVVNYIGRSLPNMILNDLGMEEMPIAKALGFLTSHGTLSIPYGTFLPKIVDNREISYNYDGSPWVGVKKTVQNTYRAYYLADGQEVFIDTFTNEAAATNAVRLAYQKLGQPDPNNLQPIQIMTEEAVQNYRVMTKQELIELNRRLSLERRLNERYVIGETYTNDNGRRYKVLDRPNIEGIHSRYFPVTIQYEDESSPVIMSASTLEKLRTIKHDRTRMVKASMRTQNQHKSTDPLEPTLYGVGFAGQTKSSMTQEFRMGKLLWNRMFNAVSDFGKHKERLLSIDKRWCNLSLFLEDLPGLPGYEEWKATGFAKGYAIENRSKQMHLPLDQRVWSPDICTIMHKKQNTINAKRDLFLPSNQPQEGSYRGVMETFHNGVPRYAAKVTKFGTGQIYNIGTFNHKEMAAAACDYYNQYLNGVSFNGIGDSVPLSEWQKDKSRIRLLYHVIERPLYTLTSEDEEVRRERCKRIYGIDI